MEANNTLSQLFWETLEGNSKSARDFHRAINGSQCIDFQGAWSGIDTVIQIRRQAVLKNNTAIIATINNQVENALVDLKNRLSGATFADLDSLGSITGNAVKALLVLVERFPVQGVYKAFLEALISTKNTNPETRKKEIIRFLLPTWKRTISVATNTDLCKIFASEILTPPEYFSGFMMAWRSSIRDVLNYAEALAKTRDELPSITQPFEEASNNKATELVINAITKNQKISQNTFGSIQQIIELLQASHLPNLTNWLTDLLFDNNYADKLPDWGNSESDSINNCFTPAYFHDIDLNWEFA